MTLITDEFLGKSKNQSWGKLVPLAPYPWKEYMEPSTKNISFWRLLPQIHFSRIGGLTLPSEREFSRPHPCSVTPKASSVCKM